MGGALMKKPQELINLMQDAIENEEIEEPYSVLISIMTKEGIRTSNLRVDSAILNFHLKAVAQWIELITDPEVDTSEFKRDEDGVAHVTEALAVRNFLRNKEL